MSRFPTMRGGRRTEAARSEFRGRAAVIAAHDQGAPCTAADLIPASAPSGAYAYCDTCRAPKWTDAELLARLEA